MDALPTHSETTSFPSQFTNRLITRLAYLLVFLVGTLWIMPIFDLFVFDNDEGINVIKATLLADGYALYTQTWSDQPPIFTQILQIAFALFGEEMAVARLTVLALATLFVWAFTSTVEMQLGSAATWVALLLLMLSDNFLRLSVSVMIGLPALSFAMVAVYLLQQYKARQRLWLLLFAALAMAVSAQTKVFTLVLAPAMALDLINFGQDLDENRAAFWAKLRICLLWGSGTALFYLLLGFFYSAINPAMLLGSHLNEGVQSAYADENSLGALTNLLVYDYGHLLLAILGIFTIATQRIRRGLLPLIWLVLAVGLLVNHRPIWYHHYQLVSIPLCWLGAYGVQSLLQRQRTTRRDGFSDTFRWRDNKLITTLVVAMVVGLIYIRGSRSIPHYNQRDYDRTIVAQLRADAAATEWVFADRATYPFYAGLRVPPEIAVFSRKRFFGENLNNQILLDVMQNYRPEQVLLTRFKDELLADAEFAAYLNDHYTMIQEHPDYVYYRLQ